MSKPIRGPYGIPMGHLPLHVQLTAWTLRHNPSWFNVLPHAKEMLHCLATLNPMKSGARLSKRTTQRK